MKDKILNNIHKKICEGFVETNFLTPNEFEQEFSAISNTLLDTLLSWQKGYEQLKAAQDKSIMKSKEEYIIECFSGIDNIIHNSRGVNYELTIKNIKKIKRDYNSKYEHYKDNYYKALEEEDKNIITPFSKFVNSKIPQYLSNRIKKRDTEETLNIEILFWDFVYNSEIYIKRAGIEKTLENLLILFKEDYFSNTFLKLLVLSETYLADIQFSGSESCFVNVGERTSSLEKSGWLNKYFRVYNNGKTYSFSSSSKNEKEINGSFVHIFILDIQKKRLQKIAITIDETEQTTFIINKEFEKISIKNELEIYIEKHYGNETIIFDSRKEVLEFYEEIIKIKEGRKPKY